MAKIKSLKGLGNKYGATLRKKYTTVYIALKAKRKCPECGSKRFSRATNGVWGCNKCGYKVSGEAYNV